MKTVNFQLDHHNSIEIKQVDDQLFEVRLELNGRIYVLYMTRDQLGADQRIEAIHAKLLNDFLPSIE